MRYELFQQETLKKCLKLAREFKKQLYLLGMFMNTYAMKLIVVNSVVDLSKLEYDESYRKKTTR